MWPTGHYRPMLEHMASPDVGVIHCVIAGTCLEDPTLSHPIVHTWLSIWTAVSFQRWVSLFLMKICHMQIDILPKECWSRLELTIFEYHLCQTLFWVLEIDQGKNTKSLSLWRLRLKLTIKKVRKLTCIMWTGDMWNEKTTWSKGNKEFGYVEVGIVAVRAFPEKVPLIQCHLRRGCEDMRHGLVEECSTLISKGEGWRWAHPSRVQGAKEAWGLDEWSEGRRAGHGMKEVTGDRVESLRGHFKGFGFYSEWTGASWESLRENTNVAQLICFKRFSLEFMLTVDYQRARAEIETPIRNYDNNPGERWWWLGPGC